MSLDTGARVAQYRLERRLGAGGMGEVFLRGTRGWIGWSPSSSWSPRPTNHRAAGSSTRTADAPTMSQISQADVVVGTPGYMAPEQIRNEPADFRTDVFALGCVLYECLTGGRAFQGATTAELIGQVLHVDPPAVSSLVPELGPAYDALCARLLHEAPSERFQSAEEVLGAIRALTPSVRLSSSTSVVAVAPRPGRHAESRSSRALWRSPSQRCGSGSTRGPCPVTERAAAGMARPLI